jgi:uncharacterized protein YndB with AHSA1/START domain
MQTNFYKTAEVQKTSETTVEVKRSFKAKQDLVFKAYTTPSLIQVWCCAMPGWEMPECEMDVREGRKYRWRWKNNADKSEFGFHGVFRQVVPSLKLAHTQVFDPGTMGGDMGSECLITVTFLELNGVTTVTTEIKYQCKEDMDKALATGMTDGMEISYQKPEGMLH